MAIEITTANDATKAGIRNALSCAPQSGNATFASINFTGNATDLIESYVNEYGEKYFTITSTSNTFKEGIEIRSYTPSSNPEVHATAQLYIDNGLYHYGNGQVAFFGYNNEGLGSNGGGITFYNLGVYGIYDSLSVENNNYLTYNGPRLFGYDSINSNTSIVLGDGVYAGGFTADGFVMVGQNGANPGGGPYQPGTMYFNYTNQILYYADGYGTFQPLANPISQTPSFESITFTNGANLPVNATANTTDGRFLFNYNINYGAGGFTNRGLVMVGREGSDPVTGHAGTIYFNYSNGHFYGFNGSIWKQLDN